MKGDDELQRLAGRLAALDAEQAQQAIAIEVACRKRLASCDTLIGAAVVGAVLGLLGGAKPNRSSRAHHASAAPATTGGATLLVALAGLAGTASRLLELGVMLKSRSPDRRRD